MSKKFEVGYSGKYIDEDGEEMIIVSSDFEAEIHEKEHFGKLLDYVVSEIDGEIKSLTITLKAKE